MRLIILHTLIGSKDLRKLRGYIEEHKEDSNFKTTINECDTISSKNALDIAVKNYKQTRDNDLLDIINFLIKNGAKSHSESMPSLGTNERTTNEEDEDSFNDGGVSDEEEEEEFENKEEEEEDDDFGESACEHENLVDRITNCKDNSALYNTLTLVSLYKFYDKNFINLDKKNQVDLFNAHLNFIINFPQKNELDDYFLLDFAKRIYPYLDHENKNKFVLYIGKNSNDDTTPGTIQKILSQQERHSGFLGRYSSLSSDKPNLIYPAKSLNNGGEIIQFQALQIAEDLALKTARSEAEKPEKKNETTTPSEEKQRVDTIDAVLPNIIREGPKNIKKFLNGSYLLEDENKSVTKTGRELLRMESKNESGEEAPLIRILLKKAKNGKTVNAQLSAIYIEKVVVPEVLPSIPQSLKALILDTPYWKTKCSIYFPEGIKKLQNLINSGKEITFSEVQKIINGQPRQGKIGFFQHKRDTHLESLYDVIRKAKSWQDLDPANDKNTKLLEVFTDRNKVNQSPRIGNKVNYVR